MSGLPTFFRKLFSSYGNAPRIKESVTLPSQTGQSGKALVTNGTQASWSDIDALPSQTGNGGKYLTTDGTNASWSDSLDYRHVSNCVTKIPQDIKLELSSGALTLKAGSRMYVPNGVGVFDTVVLDSDYTRAKSASLYDVPDAVLFFTPSTSAIDFYATSLVYSGTTQPSGSTYPVWYDTSNNKMMLYYHNEWIERAFAFPIAIVSTDSTNGFTAINQLFNGFGYVGSTIFALPGVKGFIPNGLNADGSMKSTPFTVDSVLTHTFTNESATTRISLNAGEISWHDFVYDIESNTIDVSGSMDAGSVVIASGRVTAITPKHAHGNGTLVRTYQNGTSWYRIWSDGWIEQGGQVSFNNDGYTNQITYLKSFSNTNYTLTFGTYSKSASSNSQQHRQAGANVNLTNYGFTTWANVNYLIKHWYACGY